MEATLSRSDVVDFAEENEGVRELLEILVKGLDLDTVGARGTDGLSGDSGCCVPKISGD